MYPLASPFPNYLPTAPYPLLPSSLNNPSRSPSPRTKLGVPPSIGVPATDTLGTHPLIHPSTLLHLHLLSNSKFSSSTLKGSCTTLVTSSSPEYPAFLSPNIQNCTPIIPSITSTPAAPKKKGRAKP